jgi:hypothetical protein
MTGEELQEMLSEALAILDEISHEVYRKPDFFRSQRAVSKTIGAIIDISMALDEDLNYAMRKALK